MRINEIENKKQKINENDVHATPTVNINANVLKDYIKYNIEDNLQYNFEIDIPELIKEYKNELENLPGNVIDDIYNLNPMGKEIDTSQLETIVKGLLDAFTIKKIKEIQPSREKIEKIIKDYKNNQEE